jgi:methylated-DNA-[protein]-cysteine S-methyltransferase
MVHAALSFDAILPLPFGGIGVRVADGLVTELVYTPPSMSPVAPRTAVGRDLAKQVKAYVKSPAHVFKVPLAERGSDHQGKVWRAIAAIPSGSVLTYGDVAKQIRSAPRAVGQACGANWFPLVIPCHRVVAAGGIGGFARAADSAGDGFHIGVKRWLLAHEGVRGDW